MNNIFITFGIPMYNSEKYISELLDCFNFDDDLNYEVIIVDDGSSDSSQDIVNKYLNPKLRLISKKNGGVSSARNMVIDEARGEWVTFIDSDDLIDFKKYLSVINELKNKDIDYFIGIRRKKFYNNRAYSLNYLIEHELINSPWDKFFKRDILLNNNIRFNSLYSLSEDLLFNLEYINHSSKFDIFFDDKMYMFRNVNSDSLTHKYRKNKLDELMSVNMACKKVFFDNKSALKSLEYIKVKYCISCVKDYYIFRDKFDSISKTNSIKSMRKQYKREYFLLNNFTTSFIYLLWYFCPTKLLLLIIKLYTNA